MTRATIRTIAGGLVVLSTLLLLAACGKVGAPVPPGPPNKVTWPRTYPTH